MHRTPADQGLQPVAFGVHEAPDRGASVVDRRDDRPVQRAHGDPSGRWCAVGAGPRSAAAVRGLPHIGAKRAAHSLRRAAARSGRVGRSGEINSMHGDGVGDRDARGHDARRRRRRWSVASGVLPRWRRSSGRSGSSRSPPVGFAGCRLGCWRVASTTSCSIDRGSRTSGAATTSLTGPFQEVRFLEGGDTDDEQRGRLGRYVRCDTRHGSGFHTCLVLSDMPTNWTFPG